VVAPRLQVTQLELRQTLVLAVAGQETAVVFTALVAEVEAVSMFNS
jgi:hypothetical protein